MIDTQGNTQAVGDRLKHAQGRSLLALIVTVGIAMLHASSTQALDESGKSLQVQVASGILEGFEQAPGVLAFRGIPFAAPPVGELRWKSPQAPIGWQGVRMARNFGPDCMQFTSNPNTTAISEDCLYLNVYMPEGAKAGDKLPVHVWLYPGAFFKGAASSPDYNNNLGDVRAGIVYVTFNYRLNVFGFIAHPGLSAESPHGASGNYGLMDQIAALKWVQNNIDSFGGDPAQVTVSGTSAGASSIGFLLGSPLGKGLFKRALMQSTAAWHPQRTRQQQETWSLARFGSDIQALREKPAMELLALTADVQGTRDNTDTLGDGHSGPFDYIDWLPIVDGHVLLKSDRQVWADGSFNTVELMIGDVENEGLLFARLGAPIPFTLAAYESYMRTHYGKLGDEALRIYPAVTDADVGVQLGLATGDTLFALASREMSRRMVQRLHSVYRYLFTRHNKNESVAIHGAEEAYFFGRISMGDKYDGMDIVLSEIMQDAKRRFIKTGNPNGGALKDWSAYNQDDPFMEFGNSGAIAGAGHRNTELDFAIRALQLRFPLE